MKKAAATLMMFAAVRTPEVGTIAYVLSRAREPKATALLLKSIVATQEGLETAAEERAPGIGRPQGMWAAAVQRQKLARLDWSRNQSGESQGLSTSL